MADAANTADPPDDTHPEAPIEVPVLPETAPGGDLAGPQVAPGQAVPAIVAPPEAAPIPPPPTTTNPEASTILLQQLVQQMVALNAGIERIHLDQAKVIDAVTQPSPTLVQSAHHVPQPSSYQGQVNVSTRAASSAVKGESINLADFLPESESHNFDATMDNNGIIQLKGRRSKQGSIDNFLSWLPVPY